MESCIDFLKYLETDMVLAVLKSLDDPADLVRASSVSRDWRDFVIGSGLSKELCLKHFPQLAKLVDITETDSQKRTSPPDVGSSKSAEREPLARDHKVYASLLHTLRKLNSSPVPCSEKAFSASSTDNYPNESVVFTLEPRDRSATGPLYWSSKGQKDPNVPETLIYKLSSDLCVISEIHIQPFEAFFQDDDPVYSAKSVRFRMGHPKSKKEVDDYCLASKEPADDLFSWTYTSSEFAMTQENRLQQFKFPEPVLCIGGYLLIELLGRVQRQEMDGLFYICVSHVKVLGRPLTSAFHAEVQDPSGKFVLEYKSDKLDQMLESAAKGEELVGTSSGNPLCSDEIMWAHVGLLQYLMGRDQAEDLNDDHDEEGFGWDEENVMDSLSENLEFFCSM